MKALVLLGRLQAYLARGYRQSTNASERVFWATLWLIPRMTFCAAYSITVRVMKSN